MRSLAYLVLALGCAGGALAESRVTSADLAQIRAAIHRDLHAFPACAGHSMSFHDLIVVSAEDVVQQVRVTDSAGAVRVAYYAMQRQSDGSWRTGGCRLVPSARTVSA